MGLRLVTPPAEEPVTLEEAKLQCRVTHDAEDVLIEQYIRAAREACEAFQLRAWLTQTWELSLDRFPCASERNPRAGIRLPRPPLQSVESIIYTASDGSEVTMAAADYLVDTDAEPGVVYPAYGTSWPAARCYPGSVRIRYVAGYQKYHQVPGSWTQALLFEVAHYYQNRSSVETGTVATKMHRATEALLSADRVRPDLYEGL